jgi:hypothetical protein
MKRWDMKNLERRREINRTASRLYKQRVRAIAKVLKDFRMILIDDVLV